MDKRIQDWVDSNYVISMGLLTSHSVAGEFFDCFKYSIQNTNTPFRQFNVFFVKERTSKPEKLIEKGEQYFKARKLPFRTAFKYGVEANFLPVLAERGYKETDAATVMTLMALPDTNAYQKDLKIQQVSDARTLGDFQKVAAAGFGLPDGAGPFVITEAMLNLPDVEMFVGYADGAPACTSMMFKTGPVAGVYWVATLDEFRNRGFGKAITTQAVVAGKRQGCTLASLQASAMGKPVYKALGFDNPYNYRSFHSPE